MTLGWPSAPVPLPAPGSDERLHWNEAVKRIVVAVGERYPPRDRISITLRHPNGRVRHAMVPSSCMLSRRLWSAAFRYTLTQMNDQASGTPSERRDYFKGVRLKAERLLAALEPRQLRWPRWFGVDVPEDLPYTDLDVRQHIAGLAAAAGAGEAAAAARVGSSPRGDAAIQRLVDDLATIWIAVWNRKPAMSRTRPDAGGVPAGPFFRFLTASLRELRDDRCLQELRHPNDATSLDLSPEALAHHISAIQCDMAEPGPKKT